MFLGIVLICGMGPTEAGAIQGCRAFTMLFPNSDTCMQETANFYSNAELNEGHFISDLQCVPLGASS